MIICFHQPFSCCAARSWAYLGILLLSSSGALFAQARLYLNDNPQPVLVVYNLKLGADNKGAIGLFVDSGTDAFFRDIKVVAEN